VSLPAETSASEVVSAAQIQPLGLCVPWTELGSEVEIGSPDGSRDSWWSVQPGDGGAMLVDLGTKVSNRSAPCGICGVQHTVLVTQVNEPVMTEVLLRSLSVVSGCDR
jgi:hypothetical protein